MSDDQATIQKAVRSTNTGLASTAAKAAALGHGKRAIPSAVAAALAAVPPPDGIDHVTEWNLAPELPGGCTYRRLFCQLLWTPDSDPESQVSLSAAQVVHVTDVGDGTYLAGPAQTRDWRILARLDQLLDATDAVQLATILITCAGHACDQNRQGRRSRLRAVK